MSDPLKVWLERDGTPASPAARPAQGEHSRRGDDRRARRGACGARSETRPARHPDRRQRPAFQLRRQRRGAFPGAMRGDARGLSPPDPASARLAGAGADGRARPMPWRRPRARFERRSSPFRCPDAKFGQPEIQIGVFAPAASCLLPERIGLAAAEDLLISGRSVSAPRRPSAWASSRKSPRSGSRRARLFRPASGAQERKLAALRDARRAAGNCRARVGQARRRRDAFISTN